MTADRRLAESFVAAMEQADAAKKASADAAALHLRKTLHEKLGPIVARYERELEPFLLAIAALPARDGGKFTFENASFRKSSVTMDAKLAYTQGENTFTFGFEALTKTGGCDLINFSHGYNKGGSIYNHSGSDGTFADLRLRLAKWFAEAAPERMAELKDALLPEVRVHSGAPVPIDGPLKFRPPGAKA